MSEIQFPLNQERFFQLGQTLLEQGKTLEATDYFKKSYALKPTFALNLVVTSTLIEAGQAHDALKIAEDFESEYLKNEEFFSLYLQCLIDNNNFLKAHRIVNQKIVAATGKNLKKYAQYKKVIRQRELIFQQLEEKKVKESYDSFLSIPTMPYLEQLNTSKLAQILPQEEFYHGCQKLFLDERVHYLVKALLLEELSQLHLPKKIDILYRNQNKRTVWLPDIVPITSVPLFERLTLILENEAGNVDPILEANVLEEMRLAYALLYPFEGEFIHNPRNWVLAYLADYDAQFLVGVDEASREEIYQMAEVQAEIKKDLAGFQVGRP